MRGRFNWMRQQGLAVVGGNFYLETPIMVQVSDQPVVWWSRDPEDSRLNLGLPKSDSHLPRDLTLPPLSKLGSVVLVGRDAKNRATAMGSYREIMAARIPFLVL